MKNYRIKAFTILEVLINLVIMSIIIGVVYFIYSAFSKQIILYQSDVLKENIVTGFCLQIKRDFYEAEKIVKTTNGFDAVFYNAEVINYWISGNILIRKQGQSTDSLIINNVRLGSTKNAIGGQELIRKATIFTNHFNDKIEYTVSKNYPFALSNFRSNGD